MPRIIFEVLDRDGVPVRLTEEYFRHIEKGHPEIVAYLDQIQAVIRAPSLVTIDDDGVSHLTRLGAVSGRWQNLYLEVVVGYSGKHGQVFTALFKKVPPKGRLIWMRKG